MAITPVRGDIRQQRPEWVYKKLGAAISILPRKIFSALGNQQRVERTACAMSDQEIVCVFGDVVITSRCQITVAKQPRERHDGTVRPIEHSCEQSTPSVERSFRLLDSDLVEQPHEVTTHIMHNDDTA